MCCPQAVNNKVSVKILTIDNKWEDLVLPNSVRALVLVNLQSYAGGRNIFGKKLAKKDKERKMQKPEFNDGVLEVGFKLFDCSHAFVFLAPSNKSQRSSCC